MQLSPLPIIQQLDGNGKPYSGGLLYTFEANSSTPKQTYTDYSGDTPHSNPIILDSDGRAQVWLEPGAYKMIFTDGVGATEFDTDEIEGNTIWTVDQINSTSSESPATITIVDTYADMIALTPTYNTVVLIRGYYAIGDGGEGTYWWDVDNSEWILFNHGNIDVRWFGAKGDGTTNDTAAFNSAGDFASEFKKELIAYGGTYLLETDPTIQVPIKLEYGAILKWSRYNLGVTPIIAESDKTQHFMCTLDDAPELPTGISICPEHFGAVGDGTTDDTDAIQAALNSIATNGGTMVLLNKTYIIGAFPASYGLVISSNTNIIGNGTLKVVDAPYSLSGVIVQNNIGVPIDNVVIDGITIDGNRASSVVAKGMQLCLTKSRIVNNKIKNCSSGGIYLETATTNDTFIYGNSVNNSGTSTAIETYGTYQVLFNSIDGFPTFGQAMKVKGAIVADSYLTVADYINAPEATLDAITCDTIKINNNLDSPLGTIDSLTIDTLTVDTIVGNTHQTGLATIDGGAVLNASTSISGDLSVSGFIGGTITGVDKIVYSGTFNVVFPTSKTLVINYQIFTSGYVKLWWNDISTLDSSVAHIAAGTPIPDTPYDLRPTTSRKKYCLTDSFGLVPGLSYMTIGSDGSLRFDSYDGATVSTKLFSDCIEYKK